MFPLLTSNRAALLIYDDENTEDKPGTPKGTESECVFSGGLSPFRKSQFIFLVTIVSSWLRDTHTEGISRNGFMKLAQMVLLFLFRPMICPIGLSK